jgi:plasmid maintenance system antidote protein VapI
MTGQPKLPPNFKDTVEDTRDLVNDLIDRVAKVVGDAGQRWLDGFEKADVEQVAKDMGEELQDYAKDVWTTAEKDVKP